MSCRTVDSSVEKRLITGDKIPHPVGGRWTTRGRRLRGASPSTPCGQRAPTSPQPSDLGKPAPRHGGCGRSWDNEESPQGVEAANRSLLWIPAPRTPRFEQRAAFGELSPAVGRPRSGSRESFAEPSPGGREPSVVRCPASGVRCRGGAGTRRGEAGTRRLVADGPVCPYARMRVCAAAGRSAQGVMCSPAGASVPRCLGAGGRCRPPMAGPDAAAAGVGVTGSVGLYGRAHADEPPACRGRGPGADSGGASGSAAVSAAGTGPAGQPPRRTGAAPGCPRSAVLDAVGQLRDLVVDGAPLGHQRADLAIGVHHRGVVAATELPADLRQ